MNNRTLEIRTSELIMAVNSHDYRDELITLMEEQLLDDSMELI